HHDRRELSVLAHGASAEGRSPVAGGKGMAAIPCCTDETRRPGMQARRSVASLAALAKCVRQSNPKNNSRAQLVGGGLLQPDETAADPGALALVAYCFQRERGGERFERGD